MNTLFYFTKITEKDILTRSWALGLENIGLMEYHVNSIIQILQEIEEVKFENIIEFKANSELVSAIVKVTPLDGYSKALKLECLKKSEVSRVEVYLSKLDSDDLPELIRMFKKII